MPDIDLISVKADNSVKPDVLEVYVSLSAYMGSVYREKWKTQRELAWKAVAESEIWTDEEKKEMTNKGQAPLSTAKLSKGVQGSAAIATANRPAVQVSPVGTGDLYVAELLKRGMYHIWDKNDGNGVVYDAVEEMKTAGLMFIDSRLNPSKGLYGKIEFEECDPLDFYFSPKSRKYDLSDTHIIKAILRTKKYIKDRYGDIPEDDLKFQRQPASDKEDEKKKSAGNDGDNYASDEKEHIPGSEELAPEEYWEIEAWMLKTVRENWIVQFGDDGKGSDPIEVRKMEPEEYTEIEKRLKAEKQKIDPEGMTEVEPNKLYLWKRTLEKREQRVIVGKKLIEKSENPYGVDADGNPIIPIIARKHDRTLNGYPTCPTFKALPWAKEKSKARMQYNFAVSHMTSAPIREPIGCKWIGNPGSPDSRVIVPKDAAFPPDRMSPGSMDVGLMLQREQAADADIQDIYDLQDVMIGKNPAGNEKMAWRAVWALQEAGGTMSQPHIRKVESAITQLGKTVIAIAIRHWPRQQWERLLEEDEWSRWMPEEDKGRLEKESADQGGEFDIEKEPDVQEQIRQKWGRALELIETEKVDLLKYDVSIHAGSSMPTNRMMKQQIAMDMVSAGIYDQQAALEYVDDPKKDEITARTKAMQQQAMTEAATKNMK